MTLTPYPRIPAAREAAERPGASFRELLKDRARGPSRLGPLDGETCERAMNMILSGEATPAQATGFLLVGRAAGDSPEELAAYTRAMRGFVRPLTTERPTVTVAGGFDGKLRTLNVGAVASLVASAAGASIVHVGEEGIPPKEGRTCFDTLREVGICPPMSLEVASSSLESCGFAAITARDYLPELHALKDLRWEMTRRTALNVVEKLVSPVPDSALVVGVTHSSFVEIISRTLILLGTPLAVVYQAIEGSDEATVGSTLTLVRDGATETISPSPEELDLAPVPPSEISWTDEEDEVRLLEATLAGEATPALDLVLYNAALRLWVSEGCSGELSEYVRRARRAVESGRVAQFVEEIAHLSTGRRDVSR